MKNPKSWRREAMRELSRKIAANNGLATDIQQEIQEDIEAAKTEKDDTEKSADKENTEDSEKNRHVSTINAAEVPSSTHPGIDILV